METLQIQKTDALKAHAEAPDKGKRLLEKLFGKKVFLKDVTERIKSVDDAIKELGDNDPEVQELYKLQTAGITSHLLYYQMAIVWVKAINEGWIPDYTNPNQIKYEIVWDLSSSSGAGFSFIVYDYWGTSSRVGARLVFKSRELGQYTGKQIPHIFQKFITISK